MVKYYSRLSLQVFVNLIFCHLLICSLAIKWYSEKTGLQFLILIPMDLNIKLTTPQLSNFG